MNCFNALIKRYEFHSWHCHQLRTWHLLRVSNLMILAVP